MTISYQSFSCPKQKPAKAGSTHSASVMPILSFTACTDRVESRAQRTQRAKKPLCSNANKVFFFACVQTYRYDIRSVSSDTQQTQVTVQNY